ncbi:hypothetical protein BGW39_000893 [Mortierella sp. 14UC]|nr:hypothetical protein BGW39_000893 [Mortierella sp. 14UC]
MTYFRVSSDTAFNNYIIVEGGLNCAKGAIAEFQSSEGCKGMCKCLHGNLRLRDYFHKFKVAIRSYREA